MAIQKTKKPEAKSLSITGAEILALAGIAMKKPVVDSSGTDDGNVCRIHDATDEVIVAKADLLALIRKADGAAQRLPMGEKHERHEDGRPHDHVDAAITVERTSDGVTLRWLEA